ncbi:uncharacterized protein G2W53_021794 [Senna tora]|uniref:Uncharacterized protein n=1 Tax=Senna tora TaxID=362788 RepID=A0A834TKU7_9FABA|nr:uncharacterized protein G2W53_021794 [Senna tora]
MASSGQIERNSLDSYDTTYSYIESPTHKFIKDEPNDADSDETLYSSDKEAAPGQNNIRTTGETTGRLKQLDDTKDSRRKQLNDEAYDEGLIVVRDLKTHHIFCRSTDFDFFKEARKLGFQE